MSNLTNFSVTDTTLSAGATIIGVGADADSIYVNATTAATITFTITNDVLFDNTSDAGGTGANINMPVSISDGKTNLGIPDNNTDGTYSATGSANRPTTTTIEIDY